MTSASPIRIELVAAPATHNTLDAKERSRLLKSTRKLESVLGTTPLVIEALPSRRKREAGIFHSPSSSISSVEDVITTRKSSERDYVFVRSNVRSAPYQHQYLPSSHLMESRAPSAASFHDSSPSSSRSASPMHTPKKQRRAAPAPLDIQLALEPSSTTTTTTTTTKSKSKSKGPQPLSQPLLLRLRSVPIDGKAASGSGSSMPPCSRSSKPYPSIPLSPANSTFTIDTINTTTMSITSPPPTPKSPRTRTKSNALTDREKRKKMAKLARTLGENVPPELVFGQGKAGRRRSSVCGGVVARGGWKAGAVDVRVPMTIGEVPIPKPAAVVPATTTTTAAASNTTTTTTTTTAKSTSANSSPASIPLTITVSREIETSKSGTRSSFLIMGDPDSPYAPSSASSNDMLLTNKELGISGKGKRKHRPRSLTLGSSSAFAAFPKTSGFKSTGSKSTCASNPTATATATSTSTSTTTAHKSQSQIQHEARTRGTTSLDVQRPARVSSCEDRPLPPLPLRVRAKERADETAFARVEVRPIIRGVDVDGMRFDHATSFIDTSEGAPFGQGGTSFGQGTPFAQRDEMTPFQKRNDLLDVERNAEFEDWRRKEREWSGEWNLRDMEGVTRALRELRGR